MLPSATYELFSFLFFYAVGAMDEVLWRTERIIVGTTTFEASLDTLTCVPDSLFSQVFAEPFPWFDFERDAHIVPNKICSNPVAFDLLLDFLRSGEWAPIPSEVLHNDVCELCTSCGLRCFPRKPLLPSHHTFEYCAIPVLPVQHGDQSRRMVNENILSVVASKGELGYRLCAELPFEKWPLRSVGESHFPRGSTVVLLERASMSFPSIDAAARTSPWFLMLQGCT
jgi:hypothetical protein